MNTVWPPSSLVYTRISPEIAKGGPSFLIQKTASLRVDDFCQQMSTLFACDCVGIRLFVCVFEKRKKIQKRRRRKLENGKKGERCRITVRRDITGLVLLIETRKPLQNNSLTWFVPLIARFVVAIF